MLLIAGLIFYIVVSGNSKDTTKNDDRIDSILRIINTPAKQGAFTNETPQPIIITVPQQGSTSIGMSNDLLRAFEDMKDDNARTRAYAEAIAKKVYQNTYSDSIVDITVDDVVEGGELTKQDVKWKVKPQKVKYHESIYYLKPKFVITTGIQIGSSVSQEGYSSPQLLPTVGYRGRSGWAFKASINILNMNEFMFGFEKDILTRYSKVPEKK
jgi:hypothetical protein